MRLSWLSLNSCLLLSLWAVGCAERYQVEYWAENQPRILKPVHSAPANTPAYTLETLPLVQNQAGALRVDNEIYSLADEGLYRIRDRQSSKVIRQSIVYRKDIWRFAGHLSRLYVYGARHQDEKQPDWDRRARDGEPLSLQCGFISMFTQHHLAEQGVQARLVGCTASSNWKYYDDGHALLEIFDPTEKRWILFDPTLGARFEKEGRWLDLMEMTRLYRSGGRPRIDFLNACQKTDPLTDYHELYMRYIPTKSEVDAFVPQFVPLLENDVETIQTWYGRVMQIPVIGNYFVPESNEEDALMRTAPSWKNIIRLTASEFRAKFYLTTPTTNPS
jgi:hypothetical protein